MAETETFGQFIRRLWPEIAVAVAMIIVIGVLLYFMEKR